MSDELLVITDPDTDRYHTFSYISWWRQEVVRTATVLVIGDDLPGDFFRRQTGQRDGANAPRAQISVQPGRGAAVVFEKG